MSNAAVLRALKLTAFGLDVLLTVLGAFLSATGGYCVFLVHGAGAGRPPAADPAAVLAADAATVAVLSLTSGALLVTVGLLGCCGLGRASRPLLLGQAGLLAVLLMLQVATLAVVIWSERSAPQRAELAALELIRRRGSVDKAINRDRADPDSAPAWRAVHAMQRGLRCCGVLGYGDYVSVNATIPVSCCRDESPSASTPARCDFSGQPVAKLRRHRLLRRRGCAAPLRRRLRLLAALAYALCGLTLVVQMAALSVGCYVALTVPEAVPGLPGMYSSVQSFRSRSGGYE